MKRIIFILLFLFLGLNCFADDSRFLAQYPVEDRAIIARVSRELDIPIKYLYRLHFIESKMKANAIRYENNGSVSIGYSQLNNRSLEWFSTKFNNGVKIDPYDKETNIRVGASYIKDLYHRFDNNWISAFVSYNWGEGNLRSGKEIPQQCIEYAFTIVWGTDYVECVEIIKGAVDGIM